MYALVGSAASLLLTIEDYPPGDYNLTIEATDIYGQSAEFLLTFFLPGDIYFMT